MFISFCDSVPGDSLVFHQENRGSYLFDWEYVVALHAMQGNRSSSIGEGLSHGISRVVAGTLGIFLSYSGDGH